MKPIIGAQLRKDAFMAEAIMRMEDRHVPSESRLYESSFNSDVDRLSPGVVLFPRTPTGTGNVTVLNISKEQAEALLHELKKLHRFAKMKPGRKPNSWLFKEV